jgi:hypothetical protein
VFTEDLPKLEIAFRTLGDTISAHLQAAVEEGACP